MGSSSTVKAALAAALTAGVLDKVGAMPGMQTLKSGAEFSDKLTYNLINATGRALTNTAINGGSLEDALKAAIVGGIVDTAHGAAASRIKVLEADYIAHKLAHALAGCVAGAAAGGNCQDGAIGAAVGEMVAGLFEGQKPSITASDAEKKAYSDKVLAYSKLIAGGVSAYSGGNAQTAITTAEIAVQNNYLSKPQLTALQTELNACKVNNCTEAQTNAVLDKYVNLSAKNDAALAACTTQACVETHRKILLEAASVSSSVMWQVADARGSQQLIGELLGRQNQASNLQYLQARVERVEQARKQLDQYVITNCQGLSQSACSTKLQKSQEFSNTLTEVFVGFTPAGIAIDIKDFLQAKTMGDYSLAVLGIVLPGVGDGIKGLVKGGANGGTAVVNGLAFRSDLPIHMIGPDGFTKSGQLSGTHNLANATSALDTKGAVYTLNPTSTAGVYELPYTYTNPATGKLVSGSKTVYDPAVFSDQKMINNAQQAGQQAWTQYLRNPTVKVIDGSAGGVNFRSYINVDKNGNAFIGNVHPIK